jgi:RNA polymerase sigma factor (sigma-70 family)
MTTAAARRVAGRLAATPAADHTDTELLGRFVADRDGPAFAALVARHGPMVFGVCRRVLGDWHLAEDAFQAAFVVLARRAADVSPPGAVAGWLHGVAYRVARDAYRTARRRFRRERPVEEFPDPPVPSRSTPTDDLRGVLDDELRKLPGKYRDLLVACDLEGRPRQPVAEGLGIPEGTLSSRLTAARKMLANRLARRGIAPAAVAGVAAGGPSVAACEVPRALVASAARIGSDGPGAVPAAASTLANGAIRAMTFRTHALRAAGLLLVAASAAFGLAAGLTPADPPAPPGPPPAPAFVLAEAPKPAQPAPKPAGPGRLLVWKETQYVLLTPEGKEDGTLDQHPDDGILLVEPVLSPDGKRVAFAANENPPTDKEGNLRRHLYYRDVDGKTPGVKVELNPLTVAWDADGKALIVTEAVPFKQAKDTGSPVWRVDAATKEKTKLDLPKHVIVSAVMPDGKAFVAALFDLKTEKIHLALVSRDGKDVTKLCELRTEGPDPRPSPDGTKILFRDYDPDDKPVKDVPPLQRLYVFDLKAKTRTRLAEVPLNALQMGYCWSPDGKRIAYTWKQVQPGVPLAANTDNMNDPKINTETESHLVVCDATGKNPKTLLSIKSEFAPRITIGSVDWR